MIGSRVQRGVTDRLRLLNSPFSPAAVVLTLYMLWLGIIVPHSHGTRDFVHEGTKYASRGRSSSLIVVDQYVASQRPGGGYDGQFCYYIALDPLHAVPYMDDAPYRYTRILYPLLARLVAMGQPHIIPYALVAINWLAIAGGTLAVAAWLRRRGIPVWFAMIYGLYPGLLLGVKNDLTEPLCYAFVALAVFILDSQSRHRLVFSALAFMLATLTREASAVFPLAYALGMLAARPGAALRLRTRQAVAYLALALGPLIIYRSVLTLTMHSSGLAPSLVPTRPFAGLLAAYPWADTQIESIRSVYTPAVICFGMSLWSLKRNLWQSATWALLLNALVFAILLPPYSAGDYTNSGRISTGIVLAAMHCLPVFDAQLNKNRWWLWSSSAFWLALSPFWLFVPILDSMWRAAN